MVTRIEWCLWGVLFAFVLLAFESSCDDKAYSDYRGNITSTDDGVRERTLSRKRRFIAFPMGSSFAVSVCMTVGVLGNPNYQYLSLGLNWGVAYELPNSTWVLAHAHGFGKKGETPEPVVKRRHRRELYRRLELIIDRKTNPLGAGYSASEATYTEDSVQDFDLVHSRPKRYAAFPEGSSFTCAVCFTVGVVGSPYYSYLSYGLNWGIAYDLPNETWVLNHLHGFDSRPVPAAILKRRNRRSLYRSIEDTIDSMGFNGRDCILRSLCESRQFFKSDKMGMVPELLRTIFSLPKTRIFTRELQENADIEHYHRAYFSEEDEDCEYKYPCSFSLLELGMGKYSEPSDYYGE